MKTVFCISTQHDGLQNVSFTNIMALHKFLFFELTMGEGKISIYKQEVKRIMYSYNYEKLRYSIRQSQNKNQFVVAQLENVTGDSVTVYEVAVKS